MALTGELTPPGSSRCASPNEYLRGRSVPAVRFSAAIRPALAGVLRFPPLVLVGEVQEPDLLELGRRVEDRAVVDARLLGDPVEDRVALLLRAAVGHREHGVGPVPVGRPP